MNNQLHTRLLYSNGKCARNPSARSLGSLHCRLGRTLSSMEKCSLLPGIRIPVIYEFILIKNGHECHHYEQSVTSKNSKMSAIPTRLKHAQCQTYPNFRNINGGLYNCAMAFLYYTTSGVKKMPPSF
jgi:hypothetical protein